MWFTNNSNSTNTNAYTEHYKLESSGTAAEHVCFWNVHNGESCTDVVRVLLWLLDLIHIYYESECLVSDYYFALVLARRKLDTVYQSLQYQKVRS